MRTHPFFGMTTTKTLRSVLLWKTSCMMTRGILFIPSIEKHKDLRNPTWHSSWWMGRACKALLDGNTWITVPVWGEDSFKLLSALGRMHTQNVKLVKVSQRAKGVFFEPEKPRGCYREAPVCSGKDALKWWSQLVTVPPLGMQYVCNTYPDIWFRNFVWINIHWIPLAFSQNDKYFQI